MTPSRPALFADLRATAFAHLSQTRPGAARRHRRLAAKLAARQLAADIRAGRLDYDLPARGPEPAHDPYGSVEVTREQWHNDPQWAEVRATHPYDPFVVGTIEWDAPAGHAPGRD